MKISQKWRKCTNFMVSIYLPIYFSYGNNYGNKLAENYFNYDECPMPSKIYFGLNF